MAQPARKTRTFARSIIGWQADGARNGQQWLWGIVYAVTGYYLITRGRHYEDLGALYFDERDREAVKRLQQLGYHVELHELAPAAP